MTYTLYNAAGTGSFVVDAALAWAEAEYTRIEINLGNGLSLDGDLAHVNPMKQVPVLVLPSGEIMTESAAIAIHLSTMFPARGLAPSPGTTEHARFLRWMVFMSVNLYETDLRCFYSDRYTKGREASAHSDVKMSAIDQFHDACGVLEQELEKKGPFVSGEQISIADVYLVMLVSWMAQESDLSKFRGIARIRKEVERHPVAGPLLERHGL